MELHSENDRPLHPCCYPVAELVAGENPYFRAFLPYNNQNNKNKKKSINSNHRQIEIVCKVFRSPLLDFVADTPSVWLFFHVWRITARAKQNRGHVTTLVLTENWTQLMCSQPDFRNTAKQMERISCGVKRKI